MASLSNINGLFDVHSTGAILFNTSHGTTGQILKSNGNAAPTWVDASTVIGGPYLPLTGGTLTGNLAISGSNSLAVGGTLTVNGATTLNAALTGSTATFSGNVQGATFNGLAINTTGTNNVANQIVRTEANGYARFGWINTTSGATTSTIDRIYASNDGYIRYVTPATFRTQVTDGYYAPSSTVTGVTSVSAGNGLAASTNPIISTGTLSTVHLPSFDTRSTNPDPEDYSNLIRFDFKNNSANGLSDGGSYNGQMTWRAYGSGADMSGGYPIRLAYTANGNLWRQMGTSTTSWGSWAKFALEPSGGFLPLSGGTMTGSINMGSNNITSIGSGLSLSGYDLTSTVGLNLKVDSGNVSAITMDNAGTVTFGYYTYFPNYLFHAGDTNTRIQFTTGTVTLRGDTSILLDGPTTTNANFIGTTATFSGNVGIGATSPNEKLVLRETSNTATTTLKVEGGSYGFELSKTSQSADYAHLKPRGSSISVLRVMPNATNSDSYVEVWGSDYDNDTANWNRAYMHLSASTGNFHIKTSTTGNRPVGNLILGTNSTSDAITILDNGNVGFSDTSPNLKLTVNGAIQRKNKRGNTGKHSVGHYDRGEAVWELDPTMSSQEIADLFGGTTSTVYWDQTSGQSSLAPGGWCLYLAGGVYVGGVYNSGFPYLPVETDSPTQADYYMECYIQNVGTSQTHYMGSNEFNEGFTSLGGHPGSYGYWVMSNTNPGTSWTKVSGYIGGFSASTVGTFENGTKYWTPMALFNYGAGSGTRACRISGWKVYKVYQKGNRKLAGTLDVNSNINSETGYVRKSGVTSGGYIELGSLPGYPANAYQSLTSGGSLHFANNGKYCAFLEGTDTYFGVVNSSSQTKVLLHTNGNTYFLGGSIGIGTTSPVNTAWGSITNTRQLTIVGSNYGVITLQGSYSALTKYSMGVGGNKFYMAYDNVAGRHNIVVNSSGYVGIRDDTPSYQLDVDGTIRATGDVIAYSDARAKDNVKTIDHALEKTTKLRGVSYTRNDIEDKSTKIGVIAQEVLEVLPEVVSKDDEGKYSVSYGNIVGVLIEAIKELEARVKELENK